MPEPNLFPSFGLLPKELRDQIWEASCEPRLIKLTFETYGLDLTDPPEFLYMMGGRPPHIHFTMDDVSRPAGPYRTGQLVPSPVTPPPALSVHRESRAFLLTLGYTRWTIAIPHQHSRTIFWHPELNVISLPGTGILSSRRLNSCLAVFAHQFPLHARHQVQHLALSSANWARHRGFPVQAAELIAVRFAALRNLVVVLDDGYERDFAFVQMGARSKSGDPWRIPFVFGDFLGKASVKFALPGGGDRVRPFVQLALTEDEIIERVHGGSLPVLEEKTDG